MAQGRKNKEGQEVPINFEPVQNRIDELVRLKSKADDASEALSDAIKKTAEDSGLLATVLRRFVNARAGERFVEKKREVSQLSLVFDEVGE